MKKLSQEEIDRLIEEERAETTGTMTSLDDYNNRRMTCRFMGHGKVLKVNKYKNAYTAFCSYCATILWYRSLDEFKRPKGKKVFPDSQNVFFEYMMSDEFKDATHPTDKK